MKRVFYPLTIDGTAAAWSALHALGEDMVELVPMAAGQIPAYPPAKAEAFGYYFLGLCPPADVLIDLVELGVDILIIDRDPESRRRIEYAAERMKMVPEHDDCEANGGSSFWIIGRHEGHGAFKAIYNGNLSASLLTWRALKGLRSAPRLLEYISDRELGRYRQRASREINAFLETLPLDPAILDDINCKLETQLDDIIRIGAIVLRHIRTCIEAACQEAKPEFVAGETVPVVNSCLYHREITERLLELYPTAPFSAVYHTDKTGQRIWYIGRRSDCDVDEIARLSRRFENEP